LKRDITNLSKHSLENNFGKFFISSAHDLIGHRVGRAQNIFLAFKAYLWHLGLFIGFLPTWGQRSVPSIEPLTVQSLR